MDLADYTMEQKAAAFDALWQKVGDKLGHLRGHREMLPWPSERLHQGSTFVRVPWYEFTLQITANTPTLRHVLHLLATGESM